MIYRYIPAAIFAIAGSALLAVNVSNNVAEISRVAFAWDTAAVVVGLSGASALLSLFLARIFGLSWLTGLLAAAIILGCTATSVRLTADRIGAVNTDAAQPIIDANEKIGRLEHRIESLRKIIADQTPIEARECARFSPSRHKAEAWPNCFDARGAIAAAQTELPVRLAERNELGEKRDPQGFSARFLGWIAGPRAAAASDMIQPVMMAVLLEAATALLLMVSGLLVPASAQPVRAPIVEQMIDITPADPVVALLRQHRRGLTNDDIGTALGVSKSAASQRVTKLVAAGMVTRQRVGREVQIRVA
jgi:hypothetical protein